MKISFKHILWLLAVMLPVSMVACKKEAEPAGQSTVLPSGTAEYSFKAVLGEPVSVTAKATMDDEGKTTWQAGDEIAVWDQVSGRFVTFTNTSGEGGTAVFTFRADEGTEYDFTRAVYPASVAKAYDGVTLPSEYTLEQASSQSVIPLTGYVEADGEEGMLIRFKHLAAMMRFTLEGLPTAARTLEISSPTVSLSGSYALSGNGINDGKTEASGEDMVPQDITPDVKSGGTGAGVEIRAVEGSGKVSIDISGRSGRRAAVYVPFPVGAYTYGIALKDADDAVVWNKSVTDIKEVQRAALYRMNTVGATLGGGNGTAENPFKIASADDLVAFSALVYSDEEARDDFYEMTANIDMSDAGNFPPVGGNAYATRFTGNFNGKGHTISNLTVAPGTTHAALFGYLGGTVKNLNIAGAHVTANGNFAAAIAAAAITATVENCKVDGATSITASGSSAGSIVGLMRSGTINACASHANVSGASAVGGILGTAQPTADNSPSLIINCTYEPEYVDGHLANAKLHTSNGLAWMGGIVGAATHYNGLSNSATQQKLSNSPIKVVNCYAYPLELGTSLAASSSANVWHIGGVVGRMDTDVTVFNCFSPITYSNILRNGVRYNAHQAVKSNLLTSTGAIAGRVYTAGCTVTRTFSSRAWQRCYGSASHAETVHTLNTVQLGDPNMRGLGSTILNDVEYTVAQGGLAAALNAGAAEWNASSPEVEARNWTYYPTFGYPKPEDVDVAGPVTRKVSVIGDSISTYDGFMFSNDNYHQSKHYPNTGGNATQLTQWAPQVFNEQLTWWWRLIYDKMSNARLEVNSAWGGTTVSYFTEKTEHSVEPDASTQKNSLQGRFRDYGLGNPDVLFYFGGRNDFAAKGGNSLDLLGDSSEESLQIAFDAPSPIVYNNYSQGTVAILKTFHDANPDAKIMIMITDLMTDEYEDGARNIVDFLSAKGYDIRFANLHKRGTWNKQNDEIGVIKEQGSHPNAVGCENIANYIWDQLGSWLDE